MRYYNDYLQTNDTLTHYGVLGMKWGVRRYQNKDGSYTKAGLKRMNRRKSRIANAEKYIEGKNREIKKYNDEIKDLESRGYRSRYYRDALMNNTIYQTTLSPEEQKVFKKENPGGARLLQNEILYRKGEATARKADISRAKDIISNIKNTPVSKLTAGERAEMHSFISLGITAIGGIIGNRAGAAIGTGDSKEYYTLAGIGAGLLATLVTGEMKKTETDYWLYKNKR